MIEIRREEKEEFPQNWMQEGLLLSKWTDLLGENQVPQFLLLQADGV